METLKFLAENPEVAKNVKLEINGADLLAFGEFIHQRGLNAVRKMIPNKTDEYMSATEFAKNLGVSKVTLWEFDRKGYTHPIRVGQRKRYRRSELEQILTDRINLPKQQNNFKKGV
jgi:hypothetical protein